MHFLEAFYPERVCSIEMRKVRTRQEHEVGVTTHARYRLGRCDVTVGVAWACEWLYCRGGGWNPSREISRARKFAYS